MTEQQLKTRTETPPREFVSMEAWRPLPAFVPAEGPLEHTGRGGKHSPRSRPDGPRPRFPYMPALDGLRALAVLAVLAYHADLRWARAGFLGVDVFFVISGYLITALLLSEWRQTGQINLLEFWRRRALRLLPALLVLLAAVSVAVPLIAPDQADRLRGDLLAALTYVSNWRLVFEEQPYFQAVGRPPVLQHLWSLAVEEQFYLLWPIILAAGLALASRPRRLFRWVIAGAALSAVIMAVLYSPEGDSSRVYYGTDTRVGTILIGAALAFIWAPGRRTSSPTRRGRVLIDASGLFCLIALGWCVNQWTEFDAKLYRGGFLAVAVLAAVAVGAAAYPGTILSRRLLGSRPATWVGRRSYAIYLWHWPVFMVTRPHSDIPLTGYPLLALRLALTFALAYASFRWVEQPTRMRGLSGAFGPVNIRASGSRLPAWGGWAAPAFMTAVAVAIAIGLVIPRTAPPAPASVAMTADPPVSEFQLTGTAFAATPASGLVLTPVSPDTPVFPAAPAPVAGRPPITAVGESVLLEAKDVIFERLAGGVLIDAQVGRRVPSTVSAIQSLRERGQLGDDVIVHIGSNGVFTRSQFERLMGLLKGVPRVFIVNVKVSRPWESVNNELLAASAGRWPNVVLVDWHKVAAANPQVFYDDGVHLRPQGVKLYADLLLTTMGR